MKVNINTIRILFILVNLGIIAFIVIGYVEGMGLYPGDKGPDAGSGSSNDGLKSPAGFVYAEADYVQPESRETRLRSAASWLIPARPVPPTPIDSVTTGAAEEDPVEPETADGEPIEGGPLEKDNWHYVHAFIFPENPLKSWIRLEKKDENKSTPSTSSRYSRGRTSSSRSSSLRRSSSSSKIRSENTITLNIEERWYVDEEKGLDFKIDSVSHNELVYWTDNPKRMYKLVKVSESFYLEESREEQRLEPKKEEEGEDGEKEKEEKEKLEKEEK